MNIRKSNDQEFLKKVNSVLSAFRSVNTPVKLSDIGKATGLTDGEVQYAIGLLRDQGYDVKKLTVGKELKYSLVRFGQNDMGLYYRILGEVRTPCIITTDWHVGSFGFSEIALKTMLKDVDEYGIRDVLHVGDFYQGRGVHSMELEDCKTLSVDKQEEWGVEIIRQFPSKTRFHVVIGNHEEKMKGSVQVGHDMLLATANALNPEDPEFNYYGHVAKLSLNKAFTLLMIHSSGGLSYAKSYKAERIFDQLTERPHILATGHMHQLFAVGRPPNIIVCQAGTLQRENSYLLNKGATAQVGWFILHEFTDENALLAYRRPKVF